MTTLNTIIAEKVKDFERHFAPNFKSPDQNMWPYSDWLTTALTDAFTAGGEAANREWINALKHVTDDDGTLLYDIDCVLFSGEPSPSTPINVTE